MFFRKWVYDTPKRVLNIKRTEVNHLVLRSLSKDFSYSKMDRIYFYYIYVNFNEYSYMAKFKTYCIVSGHPRALSRHFKLSRHLLKRYSSNGFVIGMRKASF